MVEPTLLAHIFQGLNCCPVELERRPRVALGPCDFSEKSQNSALLDDVISHQWMLLAQLLPCLQTISKEACCLWVIAVLQLPATQVPAHLDEGNLIGDVSSVLLPEHVPAV